jgi:CxxC motif-containing protein (DUF1111 family)
MATRSVSRLLIATFACGSVFAQPPQPPPGPRPLPGLTPAENAAFQQGVARFLEVVSVKGTQPGTTGAGLGPRFNLNGCSGCHARPSVGGSSPAVNPQVAVATNYGATNVVPSFIQADGPVRVVRFVSDGGVHSLFTITGRLDAVGCSIAQPDFETELAQGNAVFRIPTPVYGTGLIESITDSAIVANKAANATAKAALGITGHENRSANDGTITRFGWKAQNKSLLIFSGEAYNVEEGVTNELFGTERDETPGCTFNATPEDSAPAVGMSDILAFASFMRWLAPLPPQPQNASTQRGQQDFAQIGCALCHTPSFTTGLSSSPSLSQKIVPLYSDLLVHHMGAGLADGIVQGAAAGDEFRTAPLWGLGARLFFLHDGRETDLASAIQAHSSSGSEANGSVAAFNGLSSDAKQDLLNFLKSL